jgi:hypothetical protein
MAGPQVRNTIAETPLTRNEQSRAKAVFPNF